MISIFSIVICCACQYEYPQQNQSLINHIDEISKPDFIDWTSAAEGMRIKQFIDAEQNLITVVKVDISKYDWALAQGEQPLTVGQWREALKSKGKAAVLVINGGYFDENYQSTGYLRVGDLEFGKLSTDGKNGYTGMLLIDDAGPSLRYLPAQNFNAAESIEYGLQTFPTLVWNGQNKIEQDSGQTARRTVLAADERGQIYMVISELYISLHDLADWLIASELKIHSAINLDGGTSTGLAVETEDLHYLTNSAPVPNVIYLLPADNQ